MEKILKLKDKIDLLKKILLKYKKILMAYSGGVDSSLLLKVTVDVLGSKSIIAVTADSPIYTLNELENAKSITKELKVKHIIIQQYI